MPSANKTPNYNLTQYSNNGSDKISALKDYNEDMSKIDAALNDNANNIITKADAADVTAKLATKAGEEEMTAKLATKADAADVTAKLATKAGEEEMTAKLATKAGEEEMTAKLATKADAADVTAKLATKAGEEEMTAKLATKANTSDVYSKTELGAWADNRDAKGRRITLVCMGDSYASTPANSWAVELQKLVPNSVLKNLSVGGAGWNVDTRTFIAQLQQAIADNSISKTDSNVIIVCAGGRNDILNDQQASARGVEWATAARAAFPVARIIVVPMLWDSSPTGSDVRIKYSGLMYGLTHTGGVEVVNYAYTWLKGTADCIQSDGIHPNNAGSIVIASYMASAINGTYSPRSAYALRQIGNALIQCTLSGGTVTLNWMGPMPSIGAGASNALPEWAKPNEHQYVVGVSGPNGSRVVLYQVSSDEKILKIYTPSASDQGFVGGSMTYPA
jgi:peptidyl-tRNA hydrolase/lysophospholipase L1-like esterase